MRALVAILLAGALLNRLVERKYRLTHDGKATAKGGCRPHRTFVGTLAAAGLIFAASAFLDSQQRLAIAYACGSPGTTETQSAQ